MALTPDDIEHRQFAVAPMGYDRAEVDTFLVETAASFSYAMQNLLPGVTPWTAKSAPADNHNGAAHVASEVAGILEAAQRAADTMLSEAENDAARVRAGAERHAAQAKEAADQDRERVKRLLLRSEEQAASIIAQAEQQARQRVAVAERDTLRRTRDSLARTKRRTDELERAELAAIERLREIRDQLDSALNRESISGPDSTGHTPVATQPTLDSVDVRPPHARELVAPTTSDPADATSRLVRAAVSRAASSAAGGGPRRSPDSARPSPRPSPALEPF